MRLLRALACLVLALALLAGPPVQAQPAGAMPAAAPVHHDHMEVAAAIGRGHDHDGPARSRPAHQGDACQTACCFAPAQLPARAPEAGAAGFFHAVRYVETAPSDSGRAVAPDPDIPKRDA